MLILGIPLNKSIRITDTITVTVKSIRPTQIKLGIEAPKEMKVTREELLMEHTTTHDEGDT